MLGPIELFKLIAHPKVPDSIKLNLTGYSGFYLYLQNLFMKMSALRKFLQRPYESDMCPLNAELGLLVNKDIR